MADQKTSIILDVETLNAIGSRLRECPDHIRQVTLVDLARDVHIGARACKLLAHIRFTFTEIAANTSDHDTRLEIRGLLYAAERSKPGVGQP
jgi:hypothetical protein